MSLSVCLPPPRTPRRAFAGSNAAFGMAVASSSSASTGVPHGPVLPLHAAAAEDAEVILYDPQSQLPAPPRKHVWKNTKGRREFIVTTAAHGIATAKAAKAWLTKASDEQLDAIDADMGM